MSPLRNAFARATIKIFPLPLPQPHAESVVNDHGYSLEISPRPASPLKFKSHAVARFREPGSSSRFSVTKPRVGLRDEGLPWDQAHETSSTPTGLRPLLFATMHPWAVIFHGPQPRWGWHDIWQKAHKESPS
jgi:hypothetical protein